MPTFNSVSFATSRAVLPEFHHLRSSACCDQCHNTEDNRVRGIRRNQVSLPPISTLPSLSQYLFQHIRDLEHRTIVDLLHRSLITRQIAQ